MIHGEWACWLVIYSQTFFHISKRASSGSNDNYHLGLYGAGNTLDTLALRPNLSHTWHKIKTNRSVTIGNCSDSPTAQYNAGLFQAFSEVGYQINTQAVSVEPFVNLSYAKLHTDGFQEKGGATIISASSQSDSTTFTTVGLRGSKDFFAGATKLTASSTIGWRGAHGKKKHRLQTIVLRTVRLLTFLVHPLITKEVSLVQVGLHASFSKVWRLIYPTMGKSPLKHNNMGSI